MSRMTRTKCWSLAPLAAVFAVWLAGGSGCAADNDDDAGTTSEPLGGEVNCRGDEDCPRGQLCSVERGVCYTPGEEEPRPEESRECESDADCRESGGWCEEERGICISDEPAPEPEPEPEPTACRTDADCPRGEVCSTERGICLVP